MPAVLWDITDHLASDGAIAAYLDACLEDGDSNLVAAALGDFARAKGVTDLAERTGLSPVHRGRRRWISVSAKKMLMPFCVAIATAPWLIDDSFVSEVLY